MSKLSATTGAVVVLTGLVVQLVLLALLVILKLTGNEAVATWSWWKVMTPLWAPWALVALGFVLFILTEYYED